MYTYNLKDKDIYIVLRKASLIVQIERPLVSAHVHLSIDQLYHMTSRPLSTWLMDMLLNILTQLVY